MVIYRHIRLIVNIKTFMKNLISKLIITVGVIVFAQGAFAQITTYQAPVYSTQQSVSYYQSSPQMYSTSGYSLEQDPEYIQFLIDQLEALRAQILYEQNFYGFAPASYASPEEDPAFLTFLIDQLKIEQQNLLNQPLNLYNNGFNYNSGYQQPNYYQQNTGGAYGYTWTESAGSVNNSWGMILPEVETEDPDDVDEDSAELRGEVDMNDFDNGIVFFVYGQDEDAIHDVESDYDEYSDVDDDEEDDDFEVVRVDRDLDGSDDYDEEISGLEEDEDYYVVLCVEFEDNNDERLVCGSVEEFDTDEDDDKPEVETDSARDIDEDSAELRGEVDMNDNEDGIVFFVYGEDEDEIEDVEDEDDYYDVDEDGDDLQKILVANFFNGSEDFEQKVFSLDDDTDHYFRICVEYQDDDDDSQIECGEVREFETDRD